MKDLNDLEDAFLIFASSLSSFEAYLKEANFKEDDVKLLAFQSNNILQNAFNKIEKDISRLYKIKNL
jgi:hypothetical protein|tara:strand:+ start:664 stop:864 length:201 start_codon:yes stop_codon:yes gene_type:complete